MDLWPYVHGPEAGDLQCRCTTMWKRVDMSMPLHRHVQIHTRRRNAASSRRQAALSIGHGTAGLRQHLGNIKASHFMIAAVRDTWLLYSCYGIVGRPPHRGRLYSNINVPDHASRIAADKCHIT